jgi:hypothetical protein
MKTGGLPGRLSVQRDMLETSSGIHIHLSIRSGLSNVIAVRHGGIANTIVIKLVATS